LNTAQQELSETRAKLEKQEEEITEAARVIGLNRQQIDDDRRKYDELREQQRELRQEHDQLARLWVDKSQDLALHMNELNEAKQQLAGERARLEKQKAIGGGSLDLIGDIDENFMMGGSDFVVVPNKMKRRFECHDGDCNSIAFNGSSATQFATASADKTVKLWAANSGENLATLSGASSSCLSAFFSQDDSLLIASSADHAVRVYTTSTHRTKFTLTGHKDKIVQAMATSDSRHVISASHDRSIKIFDLSTGRNANTIMCMSKPNDFTLGPDGSTIVSGHQNGHLIWYDTRESQDPTHDMELHTKAVTSVYLSLDNHKILTASRDNTLKVVDFRMQRELIAPLRHPEYQNTFDSCRARLSPNGKYAVTGSGNGSVHIFDVVNGVHVTLLKERDAHSKAVGCVAWSPLGREILSCDKDGYVVAWHYVPEQKQSM